MPQRFLSCALARSVRPLVLASNHWSIFACEVMLLVDVARLVAQIEHHAVLDRLVELVGVDVAAEDLDARLLVGLQQRRAGEADEHRVRQDRLHRLVQLAGLGAVALVDEDEDIALGLEVRRQRLLQFLDEVLATSPSSSPSSLPPNLWTSEQISHGVVALSVAIRSAPLLVR